MATLPSSPYEFLLADDQLNGILLNADATTNQPFVDITEVVGLDDNPAFRETLRDHEGADGGYIDVEFEKGREIVLTGTIYAPLNSLTNFCADLKASYAPNNKPKRLFYYLPGAGLRFMYVKSRGVHYDWTTALRIGQVPVQFSLYAEDPRSYEYPSVYQEMLLGKAAETGYTFPYSFPLTFGALATKVGETIAINNGNRPAPFTVFLSGPGSLPRLINSTTGEQIYISTSLDSGDYLKVDMLNRTVVLNDAVNRRSFVTAENWFLLQPGSNDLWLQYTGGGFGSTTILNTNYNFETAPTSWSAGTSGTISQSTDYVLFGANSGKWVSNGSALSDFLVSSPNNQVAATGSTLYTGSAWVYFPTSSWLVNATLDWYDNTVTLISSTSSTVTYPPVGKWTRLTVSGLSPSNAAFVRLRVPRGGSNIAPPSGFTFYVDNATIVAGTLPPAFARIEWNSAWR